MTVTPQGDGVPLQPAQGEQRQGNRGHLPPYTRRKIKKKHNSQDRRPPTTFPAFSPKVHGKERRQEGGGGGGGELITHYHRLGDFIL